MLPAILHNFPNSGDNQSLEFDNLSPFPPFLPTFVPPFYFSSSSCSFSICVLGVWRFHESSSIRLHLVREMDKSIWIAVPRSPTRWCAIAVRSSTEPGSFYSVVAISFAVFFHSVPVIRVPFPFSGVSRDPGNEGTCVTLSPHFISFNVSFEGNGHRDVLEFRLSWRFN